MRLVSILLGSLLFAGIPAGAQPVFPEEAQLLDQMDDEQRREYENMPPALRALAVESMKSEQPKGTPSLQERIMALSPQYNRQIDEALGARMRGVATQRAPYTIMGEAVYMRFNAREVETCENSPIDASPIDPTIGELCRIYAQQKQFAEGRVVLANVCDAFGDEERESLCEDYRRELASIAPGFPTGASRAERRLFARQMGASESGMLMMMQDCGCNELGD